jgi:hypothetical protein
VLAIEDVPFSHLTLAALLIFLRRQPRVGGVRVYQLIVGEVLDHRAGTAVASGSL